VLIECLLLLAFPWFHMAFVHWFNGIIKPQSFSRFTKKRLSIKANIENHHLPPVWADRLTLKEC
ncbi:MAG: hypothetical protein ACI9GZ_000443, partial [Bacteroidia bacterium]